MNKNPSVSPIKAVRFIASMDNDPENWVSYNIKLDGSTNMPSAYDQAMITARENDGTVFYDLGDGKLQHVKSFKNGKPV
jgi:hypothetical protein